MLDREPWAHYMYSLPHWRNGGGSRASRVRGTPGPGICKACQHQRCYRFAWNELCSTTILLTAGDRGGARHAEWQAGPHSPTCLCKLACPGLVSHVIVPMRANRCGIQPQSRLAAPSVHCCILFFSQLVCRLQVHCPEYLCHNTSSGGAIHWHHARHPLSGRSPQVSCPELAVNFLDVMRSSFIGSAFFSMSKVARKSFYCCSKAWVF